MEHALNAKAPATGSPSGRPRSHHPERVILDREAMERVSRWLDELSTRLKGSAVSRNQLVSWLITNREPELSAQEVRGLEQAFFDEIKFAEWAVKELRAAQGRGERVTLAEVVARHRSKPAERGKESGAISRASRAKTKAEPEIETSSGQNQSTDVEKSRNLLDKKPGF